VPNRVIYYFAGSAGAGAAGASDAGASAGFGSSFLQPTNAKEATKSTQSIIANNFFITFFLL